MTQKEFFSRYSFECKHARKGDTMTLSVDVFERQTHQSVVSLGQSFGYTETSAKISDVRTSGVSIKFDWDVICDESFRGLISGLILSNSDEPKQASDTINLFDRKLYPTVASFK